MSLRQLPFQKTCHNLYYNLRNYKPVRRRPTFHATNHPFCTNIQLLDASYTNWFIRTSRTLPAKLFSLAEQDPETHENHSQTRISSHLKNALTSSIGLHQPYKYPNQNQYESADQHIDVVPIHSAYRQLIIDISLLIKKGDLESVHHTLVQNKTLIDSDIILYILDESLHDAPAKQTSECDVEVPLFKASTRLDLDSPFYTYIYSRIPHLHSICKDFQYLVPKCNQAFQEHNIWLSFHMNDLATLESSVHGYLQNCSYNSKTLAYIFSGFILNYEVEFAKTLFHSVLSLGKPLRIELLENFLYQLVQVDTLFENLQRTFESWKDSIPVKPTPKIMGLLLKEHYKYATPEELGVCNKLIESYGFSDHYYIKSIHLQNLILKRESISNDKSIYKEDIVEIDQISESIIGSVDLNYFYTNWLKFFVSYSNMQMIQYILMNMKHHGTELSHEHFVLIANYYLKHGQFLYLMKYFESTQPKNQFREVYLKKLFDTFIKTYPYKAVEFTQSFHLWIKKQPNLTEGMKEKLLNSLKITKVTSQLSPYNLDRDVLETKKKKYDSIYWKSLDWKHDQNGRIFKYTDQVQYRINKGFFDVLRKGVKPDISLIIKTFKRSDLNNKKILIDLLKKVRSYDGRKIELDLIVLQAKNTKEALREYYEIIPKEKLNVNHRIKFARMLMNKNLFKQSADLLDGINTSELDDKSKMMKLNIELRNKCISSDFDSMVQTIDEFPIDEIVLSPYIYNQCCFIEKKLVSKLKHEERKEDDTSSHTSLIASIDKLRGLIADINVRLQQDEPEIAKSITTMFKFLDSWIETSSGKDLRKL